jgi:hypothetical protein
MGQATGRPKLELLPESNVNFFVKEYDAEIDKFVENGQGQVTHSILSLHDREAQAKKIKERKPRPTCGTTAKFIRDVRLLAKLNPAFAEGVNYASQSLSSVATRSTLTHSGLRSSLSDALARAHCSSLESWRERERAGARFIRRRVRKKGQWQDCLLRPS